MTLRRSVLLIAIAIVSNVLITGGAGFIGGTLAAYLEHRGFDVTRFDITLGDSGLPDLLGQDIVIHLGANSSTTETDLKKILEENFEYSKKLYEMCALYEVKFQYASSASVYGAAKSFKEDDFCTPLSPYASPVSKFIKQAQEGEITLFEKSRKYKRDFVCVDDVCEMHLRMLSHDVSGIFNVGTAHPISFRDVADIVKQNAYCLIKETPMPQNLKGQYQKFTKADNSKLLEVVGEYEWKTVEKYVEENLDVFPN